MPLLQQLDEEVSRMRFHISISNTSSCMLVLQTEQGTQTNMRMLCGCCSDVDQYWLWERYKFHGPLFNLVIISHSLLLVMWSIWAQLPSIHHPIPVLHNSISRCIFPVKRYSLFPCMKIFQVLLIHTSHREFHILINRSITRMWLETSIYFFSSGPNTRIQIRSHPLKGKEDYKSMKCIKQILSAEGIINYVLTSMPKYLLK
jgi:hypothetical protein